MLKNLRIKNFILIEDLEINFNSGFQVITGETGAGKSIIIGAIGLLCGQRGQSDLIREGAQKTILEAEFNYSADSPVVQILNEFNIDLMKDILLIRREINSKGISRAFINDTPVSLGQLSQITGFLIDLHGQHQHQKLLHKENHLHYLDAFANSHKLLQEYREKYSILQLQKKKLNESINQRKNSIDQHDLYSFQVSELDNARIEKDELDTLIIEKTRLENSETLFDVANEVGCKLYSNDNSVLDSISEALGRLEEVQKIDEDFSNLSSNLQSAKVLIEDVGRSAELLKNNIEFNPERLEEIRNREAELQWLLKKYQCTTISQLIDHHNKIKTEMNRIQNYDDEILDLENSINEQQLLLSQIAMKLSDIRKKGADILQRKMNDTLDSLGMQNGVFAVDINRIEDPEGDVLADSVKYKTTDDGIDQIEFLINLNKGETLRPLQKIASGGEISRIMLAIKSIIADVDDTDVLIFDEIDIGVSGKIAQIVGKKMKQISQNRQLVVITHLAQIASQANNHYSVQKEEKNSRVIVEVKELTHIEKIEDIAKLLGGEKISKEALANAENLLNSSQLN